MKSFFFRLGRRFFDFYRRSEKFMELVSPISGNCIRIDEVSDPTFSSKVLGDGFAVIPTSNTVVAPVSGEIKLISNTKHAFAIETMQGVEVLVHIGIETVMLNGEGFQCFTKVGAVVKVGTPIIRYDEAVMEAHGLDMTTIVVFVENGPEKVNLKSFTKHVEAGEKLE